MKTRFWRTCARIHNLEFTNLWFTYILNNRNWQIKILENEYYFRIFFQTNAHLKAFKAQPKGEKEKWQQYSLIDTNTTDEKIIAVLKEEEEFISNYFIKITVKEGTITYTIHEKKFRLKEEFGPIFGAVQTLNKKLIATGQTRHEHIKTPAHL
jgi:hypothetical protein